MYSERYIYIDIYIYKTPCLDAPSLRVPEFKFNVCRSFQKNG